MQHFRIFLLQAVNVLKEIRRDSSILESNKEKLNRKDTNTSLLWTTEENKQRLFSMLSKFHHVPTTLHHQIMQKNKTNRHLCNNMHCTREQADLKHKQGCGSLRRAEHLFG